MSTVMSAKVEFDFDSVIDRRDTWSTKWEKYRGRDVIPMWVADMDFATAPAVIEELERRIRHGVYGYTVPPAQLSPMIAATLERDYGWRIDPQWVVFLPGLVVGLSVVTCGSIATWWRARLALLPACACFTQRRGIWPGSMRAPYPIPCVVSRTLASASTTARYSVPPVMCV